MAPPRPSTERREVVARYVAARLKAQKKRSGRGFQASFARLVGTTPTHISNIITGSRAAGEDSLPGIAAAWRMSVEELERRAHRWIKEGGPLEDEESTAAQFKNRELALDTVGREFSREAHRRLRELRPRHGGDMPARWWIQHLELIEAELRVEREDPLERARRDKDDTDVLRAALKSRQKPPAEGAKRLRRPAASKKHPESGEP